MALIPAGGFFVYSVMTIFFLPSGAAWFIPKSMHAKYHPTVPSRSQGDRCRRAGFTLIELLAVISIIAILLSIGAVGIKNVGKAQGTTAGAAVAEALINEARTIAISRGTTARLIINAEDNEDLSDQNYLREMYVVYRETDEDTGEEKAGTWVRASRATKLPGKVYFDIKNSKVGFADNAGENGGGNLGPEEHPFASSKVPSMNAYYYEFNAEGICQTPGASFVCIQGAMVDGQLQGESENRAGFVVWRNGRTSIIRNTKRLNEKK